MKVVLIALLLVLPITGWMPAMADAAMYTNIPPSAADRKGVNITPYPNAISIGDDVFEITEETKIVCSVASYDEASFLRSHFKDNYAIELDLYDVRDGSSNSIIFIHREGMGNEAYQLNVSENGIEVIASTSAGWFYGVQTLSQLAANSDKKTIRIPELEITDQPRFSWRAFMLDEARYFKGKDHIKNLLDEMAYLKLNVFHWHLTDDQGWRIEIEKYPELTEVGGFRKSTRINNGKKWRSMVESGEPHGGFYTREDVKEIIKYADERHITVVPEIEMPGHASAAIAAYPWLGASKRQIEVPTEFGVFQDVFDVADPKVFQFITDVLDEVMEIFPSKVIHIGGDEIKYDHWVESPTIQKYMEDNGLANPSDLHVFFTNRISNYLESKGRRMMGWNEIVGINIHDYQKGTSDAISTVELSRRAIVHFWLGSDDLLRQAAENGFEIVNSNVVFTYLDYDYKDIPLEKAYSFDPIPEGLDVEYHDMIVGSGSQMWSEWIPSIGQLHYQVFPRIAALAEAGWTEKQNKNFADFQSRLEALLERWKSRNIFFAPDYSGEESPSPN